MKALLSKLPGPPEALVLEDVAAPVAGAGEVVLDVRAVGVNFPDSLIIEDKYQFRPTRPFAPGGEVAGMVAEVGAGVTALKVGDRVIASVGWGGMAERVVVTPAQCIAMPDAMPFDEAAAFIMTYGTSHYALRNRAVLKPGEKLLVLGAAGGVGLAAVELGKAMGATVIAAASTPEKVALAVAKGADVGVVYPVNPLDKDASRKLAEDIKTASGGGVDVVYDAVGGDYAEPALRTLNWEGRFLVIGFPAGIPKIPLNLTLLKSCQIVGVFWGAFVQREPATHASYVRELLDLYASGHIKPHVSARYPLAQGAQAIRDLMERRATGKIVIEI
jgi:NADPH2:quinone reductase